MIKIIKELLAAISEAFELFFVDANAENTFKDKKKYFG